MRMTKIEIIVKPYSGTNIADVCAEVKDLSEFIDRDISFEFNCVKISTVNQSVNEMIDSYTEQR